MYLFANSETMVTRTGTTQLLITPALTDAGTPTDPPAPAVIQHAIPSSNAPTQTHPSSRPRTALLPIPPPASIRRDSRIRAKTIFYKPHDIRAVSAVLHDIMDRHLPYSQPTTTANPPTLTSCAPTPSTHCPRHLTASLAHAFRTLVTYIQNEGYIAPAPTDHTLLNRMGYRDNMGG